MFLVNIKLLRELFYCLWLLQTNFLLIEEVFQVLRGRQSSGLRSRPFSSCVGVSKTSKVVTCPFTVWHWLWYSFHWRCYPSVYRVPLTQQLYLSRDRGATLRLGGGGGGAPLVTQYWGVTKHFFLLILYNFKNIGGHVPPLPPYSAVPVVCFCL